MTHPKLRVRVTLATILVMGACADSQDELGSHEPMDSVMVVFTRNESPVTVRRPAEPAPANLETALRWLVRGPTEAEASEGIGSWFSAETAESLHAVTLDSNGHAVVDFRDLRPVIPGASSSTGSMILLRELNQTVFQFPEVRSVEYRMEGSCDLFWEWLQYSCQIEFRSEQP